MGAPVMDWTPEEVRKVLDARNRGRLRELVTTLVPSIIAGRARLLVSKPWLTAASRGKSDDVQEVLAELFHGQPPDDARILRKFGCYEGFVMRSRALQSFVMGVTIHILQRRYRKFRVRWEELTEDLVHIQTGAAAAMPTWSIDLKSAVEKLPEDAHTLFDLLYVEHCDTDEVCARLAISSDVFHARKSRLLKRLGRLLQGD